MNTAYASRGVTLVELLVGLAIAAIVLLPLTDMLRVGADSARFVRAGLDQNADARFAINRVAAQAVAIPPGKVVPLSTTDPAIWLAPWQYALQNGALVEIDPANPIRTSVLATSVRAFELNVPEVGAGGPMLRIDLVLDRPDCQRSTFDNCTVAYARTVRLGALP